MKLHCPYCTKEIEPDQAVCPSCVTAYGEETLMLTRSYLQEMLQHSQKLYRKYDRVPKRYKVTYSTADALIKSYLFDIGKGGVFIKTTNPLKKNERIVLKIFLPDGGKELEVVGEVAWSSEKKHRTSFGKYPPGMGIKFLNLSPGDKMRIDKILRQLTT